MFISFTAFMNPEDSIKKRREKMKKDFEEFLKDNFEDPKNSDVFREKQTKENKKDKRSWE